MFASQTSSYEGEGRETIYRLYMIEAVKYLNNLVIHDDLTPIVGFGQSSIIKSYHLVFIMMKQTGWVKQFIRRLFNIVCSKE